MTKAEQHKYDTIIADYRKLGFSVMGIFTDEYTVLRDCDFNKVRVYEDGQISETLRGGEYGPKSNYQRHG